MGRPRKSSGELEARERIIAAFWKLLAVHELHEVTVCMVAAEAHCSRGSFYYHFSDMGDLMRQAIEHDMAAGAFVERILRVATEKGAPPPIEDCTWELDHLCLIMGRGGTNAVAESVIAAVLNQWREALHPEGGELKPATKLIIRYSTSGVLATILHVKTRRPQIDISAIPALPFFRTMSELTLEQISESEGVSLADVAARLSGTEKRRAS